MIERIFGFIILISFILRDFFHVVGFNSILLISGSLLGVIYLFANWWLQRPEETTVRTVLITVLYGITSFCLTYSLLFKVLYLEGSDQMSILSLICLVVTMGLDYILGFDTEKILNSRVSWRFGILSVAVLALYFVPEDYRVHMTYKNDPKFLEYYDAHKTSKSFYLIDQEYRAL